MSVLRGAKSMEEEYVQYYYCYIFPVNLVVRLFGNRRDKYNGRVEGINREMAIRLVQRSSGRSIFSRYYSAQCPNAIKTLMVNDIPTDVFIGSGYSFSPREFKTARGMYRPKLVNRKQIKPPITAKPFHALHHEFVLDLDLTDYDRLRVCCQHRAICKRCWRFMAVACELLESVLHIDFGVRNRMWLYSGGRGLHCWCFDKEMLTMDKGSRTAIIDYIQAILLPNDSVVEVLQRQLNSHPSVLRAYKIALKYVPDILQEQNCFSTPYGQQFLADYVDVHLRDNQEEENLREKIVQLIESGNGSASTINKNLSEQSGSVENPNISMRIFNLLVEHATKSANAAFVLKRIALKLAYPRIDAPVSRDITHLLRCPFSVHTSAGGRLVLPVRPEDVGQLLTDPSGILGLYTDGGLHSKREKHRLWDRLGATYGTECRKNKRFDECKRILEELCVALEKEDEAIATDNGQPQKKVQFTNL